MVLITIVTGAFVNQQTSLGGLTLYDFWQPHRSDKKHRCGSEEQFLQKIEALLGSWEPLGATAQFHGGIKDGWVN